MRQPLAGEFFVSANCVCVYVDTDDGRTCRAQFDSREGPGTPHGAATIISKEAVQVATVGRQRHRTELLPLVQRVENDRAHQER